MASADPVRETIRAKLKSEGPCWTRSFHQVKPVLDRMIADGEVLRCKPLGGRANNMVCLAPTRAAPAAWLKPSEPNGKGLFPQPAGKGLGFKISKERRAQRAAALLNKFADHLADDYEPEAAALMIGMDPAWGRWALRQICKKLGRQAR